MPGLVHTKDVKDWLHMGIIVWEEKIIIEQLMEYLSIYLIAQNEGSNGHPKEESSGLILPSHIKKK